MAGKILCHSLQGLRTKAEFTITSYQTARPNRGPNFKDPRSEKFFSGHGHFSCITHYSSLLCKTRSRNDVKAEEWSSNNNLERNVMHNFSTGRITNRLLFKLRQITLKFWDTYRTASLNGKKWRLKNIWTFIEHGLQVCKFGMLWASNYEILCFFFWYCRTANLTGLRQVAAPFDDDDDDDEWDWWQPSRR